MKVAPPVVFSLLYYPAVDLSTTSLAASARRPSGALVLHSLTKDDAVLDRANHLCRSAFLAAVIEVPVDAYAASSEEELLPLRPEREGQSSATPKATSASFQPSALRNSTILTAREEYISSRPGAALTVTQSLAKYPLDTATVRLQMPAITFSAKRPMVHFTVCYIDLVNPFALNISGGAVF